MKMVFHSGGPRCDRLTCCAIRKIRCEGGDESSVDHGQGVGLGLLAGVRRGAGQTPGGAVRAACLRARSLPFATAWRAVVAVLQRSVWSRQSLDGPRSEEHTSELQSRENLVSRLLLEKKNTSGT